MTIRRNGASNKLRGAFFSDLRDKKIYNKSFFLSFVFCSSPIMSTNSKIMLFLFNQKTSSHLPAEVYDNKAQTFLIGFVATSYFFLWKSR